VFGVALIAELRRHGYAIGPGTLYPVLHQLETARYLSRLDRVVDGKIRKYYTLTRRGHRALADASEKISELVGEVLAGAPAAKHQPARTPATRTRRGPR
jgi:DNA-binding PadR family transcriptional regulator